MSGTGTLYELDRCADVAELRASLHKLCAQFGAVQHLDILTSVHEGAQQAIGFLRLADAEQEQAFMRAFGVGCFDGELVVVFDLPDKPENVEDDAFKPSSQWADFGAM